MEEVYRELAKKLDQLPHGYPATESGVELRILQKIFRPEEAAMALKLRPIPEPAEAIAQRIGKPLPEMQSILDDMTRKGQIGSIKTGEQQTYALFPFVVGIFEFQMNRMDEELATLCHEYAPSLAAVLGKFAPALTRVVPVNSQVKAEHQVFAYEDVREIFGKAKSFQQMDCICRKENALLGKPCKHPSDVCLAFSSHEGAFDKYPLGKIISREEALAIAGRAEEEGLVHLTYNMQDESFFMCNCCSCCCHSLRGMKEYNMPFMLAKSHYFAAIEPETCTACGTCADERCPMDAVVEDNGSYRVQPERCIGCGVCTTTCPTESITLIRKPESEQDEPPANILDWYFKRSQNRGVTMPMA